jgi:putative aldouronate transport system substrate-binding protein
LYDTMMKQVDAAGLPKLEEVYNKNYEERMKLWE